MTSHIMDLFGNKPLRPSRSQPLFDTRAVLELEFTCKPFQYGYRKLMFGIEMKLGPKRLYIVQRLREFLDHVARREAYVFSKHFTYDPKLHSFQKEDDVVIRQLIEIYHNEQMYHETSTIHSVHANHLSGNRMLLVPPFSWTTFLPALNQAKSVKLEQNDRTFDGIRVSEEPIPLLFEFDQTRPKASNWMSKVWIRLQLWNRMGLSLSMES